MVGWACDDGDDSSGTGFIELSSSQLEDIEQRMLPPMQRENELFDELRDGPADAAAVRSYVEQIYSEDAVFDDPTFGDHAEGHDELERMYRQFTSYLAEAEMDFRVPLTGDTTALQVVRAWDMSFGAVSFTEDEPYVEIARYEVDDDRVGSFNLYYDVANLQRIAGDVAAVDSVVQERYAEAWASGDAGQVAALYADDAERHDGLAGIDLVGADAIGAEAVRWAAALGNPSWDVSLAFAEKRGAPGQDQLGAIYTMTADGCAVDVGIVFDTDENGRITREVIHYDTATLRSCGWVN
jgi:ketosteroid isomerase-like protein